MIKKIQFLISLLTIIDHLNNFQTNSSLLVEIKGNVVIEQINNNENGNNQSSTTGSEDLTLAGGKTYVNVNDTNVVATAQFAIDQLYGNVDYKIVSAQKQVVAGINYFLTINLTNTGQQCQITVYNKFGDKSITSNICSSCPGCKSYADINDPNVIDAVQFAIVQLYDNVDYKIVSAQTQVVAGTIYFLIINLPDTGQQCQITVYDKFGDKSITSNVCTTCPGCKSYVNVNDANVVAASNYIIAKGEFPFSFTNYRLVSAEQQIVEGVKYYLRYIFPDNGDRICDVEVICQSWMQPQYSIISISCPGTAGIN
jgi:predicted Zn-ribbon and HTH transcriptional regulator